MLCLVVVCTLSAQTSDKNRGCIPLSVKFDAPQAATYYWDFGDGGDSQLKEPEHIFTSAGSYTVSLYTDNTKTNLIGSIDITVYPDLVINIDADRQEGCVPAEINFTSNVIKNSEIETEGFLWTFGDGASSNQQNPDYTYEIPGVYDISLMVTTNIPDCDKTIIVEDYIDLFAYKAEIESDRDFSCESPATFSITNLSDQESGFTYEWLLNDVPLSSDFDISEIEIDEPGFYVLAFRLTSVEGCRAVGILTLSVGSPVIDVVLDEATCPELPITLENNSSGSKHRWDFGEGSEPQVSTEKAPEVRYSTTGLKTITYRNKQSLCETDTTFTILVTDDLASFSVSPETVCGDTIDYILTSDYNINGDYFWNEQSTPGGPNFNFTRISPERDSCYINDLETIDFSLEIESRNGCKASSEFSFEAQLPEAFFFPNRVIGLAPLTIEFFDRSSSTEAITKREWDFKDGTILEVDTSMTTVTHTFTEPGTYCVQLSIENEAGCEDSSKGTCIEVLEFSTEIDTGGIIVGSDVEIGDGDSMNPNNGQPLCVGETLPFRLDRDSPHDIHLVTDDGRFSLCWRDDVAYHTFMHPGEFPIIFILEEKGFELFRDTLGSLEVVGPRAEMTYKKNCDDQHEIALENNSVNEDEITWYHNGNEIGNQEAFTYRLEEAGPHEIVLEARGENGQCANRDTAIVYVTDPQSIFSVESILCDNLPYPLDAGASLDVKDYCSNSYLWEFETQRPREVNGAELNHVFNSGKQTVSLTVTDINGCTHKSSNKVAVYGIELDYAFPEVLCFPHTQEFDNISTSDTTIVGWEWNFGSDIASPDHTFTAGDTTYVVEDTLQVVLYAEDALGCRDSLVKESLIYDPESEIIVLTEQLLCEGAPVEITATDYTEHGTQLLFDWDFASGGQSDSIYNIVMFSSSGEQTIQLITQAAGTQCLDTLSLDINVEPAPNADFISSVDSLETICYPSTIEFTNTSQSTTNVSYIWDLGNGSNSVLTNPATSYEKGQYTVTLTAASNLGCLGTKQMTYELVGPEGDIGLDKDILCLGEEIKLELLNPVDVNEWQWDMGDGTTYDNQDIINHTYEFLPSDGVNEIKLILKSAETGCTIDKSVPVSIHEIMAEFESVEGLFYCSGLAQFINNSIGADQFLWDFGGEDQSTEEEPSYVFSDNGEKLVTLTATDVESGCESQFSLTIDVVGEDPDFSLFPNVFSPNQDGWNDFFRPIIPQGYDDVIQVNSFKVYDRWGQKLFDNDSPEGWDGTNKGEEMPSDVYAYFIELEVTDCKTINQKGNVTLIR